MHEPLKRIFLSFVLLTSACASTTQNTATTTAVPAPAPAASDSAVATDAVVASDAEPEVTRSEDHVIPDRVDLDTIQQCDDVCAREDLPRIVEAIGMIDTRPQLAAMYLMAARPLIAHVWAAYAAQRAQRAEWARSEHDLVVEMAQPWEAVQQAQDPFVADLLYSLRRILDDRLQRTLENEPRLFPCWIFTRHGRDAMAAFSPQHGSNRDANAQTLVSRCYDEALAQAVPEPRRAAIVRAQRELLNAMYRVIPRPRDGSIYTAYGIDAANALLSAVLVPSQPPANGEASLEVTARAVPREYGNVRARLAAFRRARDQHAPVFAEAICGAARVQSVQIDDAECRRRAVSAADNMLRGWMTAMSDR